MRPKLRYYDLGNDVVAFSTTRHGGVSKGNYATFNINRYCGDEPEAIAKNRALLCNELAIEDKDLIFPHQVHQTEIRQISSEFLSLPTDAQAHTLDGVDALMTDLPNICIGVSTADCIPIVVYAPTSHAVATIHAGWRGTVAAITRKVVATMRKTYNCNPKEMHAAIGPGISKEHFEVGDEVYEAFLQAGFDMCLLAERYLANANGENKQAYKWHIDLPLCNRMQLISAGLEPANIQMSDICTFAQADDYFSARRLTIHSGRIFTGAILRRHI